MHARNAWLVGLSPKDNREVPPLRYETVYDLARQFPDSVFVLNGGLADHAQALHAIGSLEGVMLGRAAYQRPALLAEVDRIWFEANDSDPTLNPPDRLVADLAPYTANMN